MLVKDYKFVLKHLIFSIDSNKLILHLVKNTESAIKRNFYLTGQAMGFYSRPKHVRAHMGTFRPVLNLFIRVGGNQSFYRPLLICVSNLGRVSILKKKKKKN